MGTRSAVVTLASNYRPSDMLDGGPMVFRLLEEIRVHEANRVHANGRVLDPTTPSSQATGTGNTLWNINLELAGVSTLVTVDGVVAELAAAADIAIHSGSYLAGFTVGKACMAAVVVKRDGASFSIVTVKGDVALAAAVRPPSEAAILAAVGAGKPWVMLAMDRLERTADLTVAQTHDNTQKPILGVTAGLQIDL